MKTHVKIMSIVIAAVIMVSLIITVVAVGYSNNQYPEQGVVGAVKSGFETISEKTTKLVSTNKSSSSEQNGENVKEANVSSVIEGEAISLDSLLSLKPETQYLMRYDGNSNMFYFSKKHQLQGDGLPIDAPGEMYLKEGDKFIKLRTETYQKNYSSEIIPPIGKEDTLVVKAYYKDDELMGATGFSSYGTKKAICFSNGTLLWRHYDNIGSIFTSDVDLQDINESFMKDYYKKLEQRAINEFGKSLKDLGEHYGGYLGVKMNPSRTMVAYSSTIEDPKYTGFSSTIYILDEKLNKKALIPWKENEKLMPERWLNDELLLYTHEKHEPVIKNKETILIGSGRKPYIINIKTGEIKEGFNISQASNDGIYFGGSTMLIDKVVYNVIYWNHKEKIEKVIDTIVFTNTSGDTSSMAYKKAREMHPDLWNSLEWSDDADEGITIREVKRISRSFYRIYNIKTNEKIQIPIYTDPNNQVNIDSENARITFLNIFDCDENGKIIRNDDIRIRSFDLKTGKLLEETTQEIKERELLRVATDLGNGKLYYQTEIMPEDNSSQESTKKVGRLVLFAQ